jgi:hypothetical protein
VHPTTLTADERHSLAVEVGCVNGDAMACLEYAEAFESEEHNPIATAVFMTVLGLTPVGVAMDIDDSVKCADSPTASCAGWTIVGFLPFGDFFKGLRRNACSFTADTHVLIADGTTRPIGEIEPDDVVLATDPGSGQTAPKIVIAAYVHDDTVVDLQLQNGEVVTTTEDHPFWNATDQEWQQAQHLDSGDQLLTPDGTATVGRLNWLTANVEPAHNLTVADYHTYYVVAGNTAVLVHNCPEDVPAEPKYENPGHHDPKGGPNPYDPKKSVLPDDAQAQFANSVLVGTARWTKVGTGRDAVYYRYFDDGNGNWHWSGSTNGVNNRGEQVSIPLDLVPISVRRS